MSEEIKNNEETGNNESWEISPPGISPHRYHLSDERKSVTVQFKIYPRIEDGSNNTPPPPVDGKFIVGLFPDGTPHQDQHQS